VWLLHGKVPRKCVCWWYTPTTEATTLPEGNEEKVEEKNSQKLSEFNSIVIFFFFCGPSHHHHQWLNGKELDSTFALPRPCPCAKRRSRCIVVLVVFYMSTSKIE
jgi:hypothetical protein